MDPSPIKLFLNKLDSDSAYVQYKRDTGVIATWLAQTAMAHGYAPASIRAAKKNQKKKNKQGKTKKKSEAADGAEAGEEDAGRQGSAGAEGTATEQDSPIREYILQLPEFIDIARFLAEQLVAIPFDLIRLIKRCIRARTETLKRYSAANSDTDESNDSHQHFVGVLHDVRSILEPLALREPKARTSDAPMTPVPTTASPPNSRTDNRFAELSPASGSHEHTQNTAEDDDEDGDLTLPPPGGPTKPTAAPRARFAPEQDRLECLRAVLGFLERVEDLRKEVQSLWRRFRHGEVELIPSAVATNTVLEQLRLEHNVLSPSLARLIDDKSPLGLIFGMLGLVSKVGPVKFDPKKPAHELTDDEAEVMGMHELCLTPMWSLLGDILEYHFEGVLHCEPIDIDGTYDDSIDAFDPDGHDNPEAKAKVTGRWRNTRVLVGEAYPHYLALLATAADCFTDKLPLDLGENQYLFDEMALEMHRFNKSGEWTLITLVHAQMYADIASSAGRAASQRAAAELKAGAKRMMDQLDQTGFDSKTAMHPDLWCRDRTYGRMILAYINLAPWAHPTTDPVKELAIDHNEEVWCGMDDIPRVDPSAPSFIDYSPMFCGLLLLSLRLDMRHRTADVVRGHHLFNTTAHLYFTAKLHAGELLPTQAPTVSAPSTPAVHDETMPNDRRGDSVEVPETLIPPWPRMEQAIRLHGENKVFGGHDPKSFKDLAFSLQLATGFRSNMLGFIRHGLAIDPLADPRTKRPSHIAHTHNPLAVNDLIEGRNLSRYKTKERPELEDHATALQVLTDKYAPDRSGEMYLDVGRLVSIVSTARAAGPSSPAQSTRPTTSPSDDSHGDGDVAPKSNEAARKARKKQRKGQNRARRVGAVADTADNGNGDTGTNRAVWTGTDGALSVADIARIVSDCLEQNRHALEFDYIQLHIECLGALQAMKRANEAWLTSWWRGGWPATDISLDDVPAMMMLEYIPACILQLAVSPAEERNGDVILRPVWPKGDLRMHVLDRMVQTVRGFLCGLKASEGTMAASTSG